jgi:excisionase family DNA binding protein
MTTVITEQETPVLHAKGVASLLGCSVRHIFRLAAEGRMPRPVKIGHLARWRRSDLDTWLAAGCPANEGGGDDAGTPNAPNALAAFEKDRQAATPTAPKPKRRKKTTQIDFYPD